MPRDQCCGSGMFIPDTVTEFFHPESGSAKLIDTECKYF
jgi:hypothetical protein